MYKTPLLSLLIFNFVMATEVYDQYPTNFDKPQNDLQKENLKGYVKYIETGSIDMTDKNDSIHNKSFTPHRKIFFNQKGNYEKEISYQDGKVEYTIEYSYDSLGQLSEEKAKTGNGELIWSKSCENKNKERIKLCHYHDDKFIKTTKEIRDRNNNVIEFVEHDSLNNKEHKIKNVYDENNHLIKVIDERTDYGKRDVNLFYYDEQGNRIKEIVPKYKEWGKILFLFKFDSLNQEYLVECYLDENKLHWKEKRVFDDNGIISDKKRYMSDGKLVRRTIKNKNSIIDSSIIKQGWYILDQKSITNESRISKKEYFNTKGKLISSRITKYELDNNGNWIRSKLKYRNHKFLWFYKEISVSSYQKIKYYNNDI